MPPSRIATATLAAFSMVAALVGAPAVVALAQSQNEVLVNVLYDGTPGYDAGDPDAASGSAPEPHTPGDDGGPQNLVVRTHDQFAVRVDWNVNEDAATNVVLEVVLPPEAQWNPDQTGMFAGCDPALSSFPNPQTLLCGLGDQPEGSNGTIRPVAFLNVALDNTTFDVTTTLTTTDDPSGVNDGLDQHLTVSEGPVVDYIKAEPATSELVNSVGEDGYVVLYPLTLTDGSQGAPIKGAGPINDLVPVMLYDHMWDLTTSVRLATAAEMTAAGFAGAPCGDYAQSGPHVVGNGSWACGSETTGAGGYPVVPITVSGFTSVPAPSALADGSANAGNPQISSGQIAVWLSEAEVLAEISNASNTSSVSATFENAIVADDESVVIASAADINEALGHGTSVSEVTGDPGNNNVPVLFGDVTPTGGAGGGGVGHHIQWWNGDFMLAESERYGQTIRDNAVAAYGGSAGFPSGLPANTEVYYGVVGGDENRIEVARGQKLTLFAQFEAGYGAPGAVTDPLSGCVAFDTAHYTLVEHGAIPLLDIDPADLNGIRMAAVPSQARSVSTVSSSDGPLVHVLAGEQLRTTRRYGALDYGIGGETFPYVVEFTNAPVPTYSGTQTGVSHDGLTCNDGDAGSLGWVPSTGNVGVFDADNDGRYELLTRARVRAIGPVDWHNEWSRYGAGQSLNLYFQTQVKTDLNVNSDDQELFAFASHAIGEWVDGAPPTGSCRPHNTGLWGHAQIDPTTGALSDPLVFPPDGNDVDTTTGWCNNRFEDTGADSFDVSDGVDWDESSFTYATGVGMTMASGTMVYISEVQPRVAKQNLEGLADVKDNDQLVQFKITPSAVGGDVEALTDLVVTDNLPANYEFQRFVDLPDVPHEVLSSGQSIRIRYSDATPDADATLPAGLPGGWPTQNTPAGCTPGTDCGFVAADASFTIEVMVTGAIADPDSPTVLINTARIDSGGTGPWDPGDADEPGSFSDTPIANPQNHQAQAFSYMPLPADEGAVVKALEVFEGDCVVHPSGVVPVGWADDCEMIDYSMASVVDAAGDMAFTLSLENEGNTAFHNIRFVDVFPHNADEVEPISNTNTVSGSPQTDGDGRSPETDIAGTVGYVSLTGADVVWVSGDDPSTISRDPDRAISGTTWCDAAGGTVMNLGNTGSGVCPATNADVTATYSVVDGPLNPDQTVTKTLWLDSTGAECDDIWTNTFGARVDEILLPIRSNDVSIMVNCEYDLALRKTLDPAWTPATDWVDPGTSTVEFVIEVHNQGDPVNNFEVTDYVDPAMFTFDPALNLGGNTLDTLALPFTWDSSGANPVVTVNESAHPLHLPTSNLIAVDAVVLVPITLTVAPGFTGSDLDNYAEISYFDSDNDPSNGDSNPDNPANANGPLVDVDSLPDGLQGDTMVDDVIDSDITAGGPDEDDHDIAKVPVWDLAIDKELGASQGGVIDVSTSPPTVTFDVTVTNEGNMDAFFVDILDTPPAGLTFNSSTPPAGATVTGPNMWEIASLAAGDSVTIPVVYDVTDLTLSPYVNSVQITDFDDDADLVTPDADTTQDIDSATNDGLDGGGGDDTDHTMRNEDDDDVVEVVLPYDLALRKRLDPASPDLADGLQDGDKVWFNIEVHNQLASVESFDVTDYIQPGWEPFDLSLQALTTTGGTVSGLPVTWSATNPLTPVASVTGGLAGGEMTVVQIVLVADIPNSPTTVLDNLAEISAFDNDTDPTNTAPVDVDSTPDGVNDDRLVDDEIDDDGTTDEDDHDIASTTWFDVALTKDIWDGATCGDGPMAITAATTSVEYCLTITNQGPSDVHGVSFADTPPAGLTFSSTTDLPAGVVDNGGGSYTATMTAPGASYTVRVDYTLDLTAVSGPLTNVAEVTAMFEDAAGAIPAADVDSFPDDTPDTDTPVEDDEDAETLVLPFDLALQKQLTAVDGDLFTFAITVTNQSISVMNFDVTDYIDAGMWEPFDPSLNGGGLAEGTSASSFFYNWHASDALNPVAMVTPVVAGDMFATGETVVLEVTLRLADNFAGTELVNWAEISDFDDNNNPADGTGADGTLVDVDSTPDGVDGNGPGENPDVTNVDDDITGDGTAGGDEDDHDQAYAYLFDLALRKTLDTTATAMPIVPGADVTFMVEVFNQGTAHATDISVVDYVDLATWLPFDAAAQVTGGMTAGDQTLPYTWTANGTDGAVAITGTLAPGESVMVPVTLTIASTATPGSDLLNTAEISAATPLDGAGVTVMLPDGTPISDVDSTPDTTNDDVLVDDEVDDDGTNDEDDHDVAAITLPTYDLALIKTLTDVTDTVATFTVTVTNQGDINSGLITITDTIPAGTVFVSADNGGTETAAGSGVVEWLIANVSPGARKDLLLTVEAVDLTLAPYVNNAAITGAPHVDEDSDPSDGNAEVIDRIVGDEDIDFEDGDTDDHDIAAFDPGAYDMALIKTLESVVGTEATFTVKVTNQGAISSGQLTITDTIPAGTTFVSADSGGAETTAGSGIVEWSIPNIGVGEAADLSITVNAVDLSLAPFVNNAAITAAPFTDEDSDPSDDNAEVIDRVAGDGGIDVEDGDTDDHDIAIFTPGAYDLALIKTLTDVADTMVTFTITVTNQGTMDSGEVTVTDTIPAGTGLVLADVGGVETTSGVVEWVIPNIEIGGSIDRTIIVEITDMALAPFTNNAAITDAPFLDEDSDPTDANDQVIDRVAGDEGIDVEVGDTDDHDIATYTPPGQGEVYDLALIKILESVDGDSATFTVRVSNQGTVDSGEIAVTDTLASGTTYVSAVGNHTADTSAGTVTWTIGNIVAGGSTDLGITVQASDMTLAPFTNNAAITSAPLTDEDSDPTDNNADVIDRFDGEQTIDHEDGDTDDHDIAVWVGADTEPDVDLNNVMGDPVAVDPLANDSINLDPTTVEIIDPVTGDRVKELTVVGEGVWTVDPTTGHITFTPETGFAGDPTPIKYQVRVLNTTETRSNTVTITYLTPPTAADQSVTTPHFTPVVLEALSVSSDLDGAVVRVELIDPATGQVGLDGAVTVPGQGTWTLLASGQVEFSPVNGFSGDASISYQAIDNDGLPSVPATLLVTVPFPSSLPFTGATSTIGIVLALMLLAMGAAYLTTSRRPARAGTTGRAQ